MPLEAHVRPLLLLEINEVPGLESEASAARIGAGAQAEARG